MQTRTDAVCGVDPFGTPGLQVAVQRAGDLQRCVVKRGRSLCLCRAKPGWQPGSAWQITGQLPEPRQEHRVLTIGLFDGIAALQVWLLEILSVKHLLGPVASSTNRSLSGWNGPVGSSVRLLRQALREASRPWILTHHATSNLTCQLLFGIKSDRGFISHIRRNAERYYQFSQFLDSARHEAQETKADLCDHFAAFKCLDIDNTRQWTLSNASARAIGLISFVASAWLNISSGVTEPCLWQCGEVNPGFHHVALWFPRRPNFHLELPSSFLLARFRSSSCMIFWSLSTKFVAT